MSCTDCSASEHRGEVFTMTHCTSFIYTLVFWLEELSPFIIEVAISYDKNVQPAFVKTLIYFLILQTLQSKFNMISLLLDNYVIIADVVHN